MKIHSFVAATNIGVIFLLAMGSAAESAELKVLAANGIQAVVEDLGPKFERATGHKLAITFSTGGATVKRERLQAVGSVPAPSTPEEYDNILRAQIETLSRVVRDAGLRPK